MTLSNYSYLIQVICKDLYDFNYSYAILIIRVDLGVMVTKREVYTPQSSRTKSSLLDGLVSSFIYLLEEGRDDLTPLQGIQSFKFSSFAIKG